MYIYTHTKYSTNEQPVSLINQNIATVNKATRISRLFTKNHKQVLYVNDIQCYKSANYL